MTVSTLLLSSRAVRDAAAAARHDDVLDAWVFSRYADVHTALSESRLSAGGAVTDDAHTAVRESARQAFPVEREADWQREMEMSARQFAKELPGGASDLVRDFAQPWALAVATLVTGAPAPRAQQLAELARTVFLAAAHSTDGDVPEEARSASLELACALSDAGANAAIATQAFVALSQTVPCFLAAAWLALLQHPDEIARLRDDRTLMPQAVEELLRYAGPSRALFRRARSDVQIGDAQVREGQSVVLMLSAAQRDPERFTDANRLDFSRDNAGLLALGRGAHYCAGAHIIRTAVSVATQALLDHVNGQAAVGDVQWIDGFAIRGPATLPIVQPDRTGTVEPLS